MSLPERDRLSHTKSEIEARLAMAFGGRVAEEMVFGAENVTTGASNDIQQATYWARRMVTEFGMSDKLGRVRYHGNEQEIFLGHSVAQQQNVSEATAELIDAEIRRLVEEAEATARRLLGENLEELHLLAKALLEHETLSGDEIKALLRGETITRPSEPVTPPDTGGGRSAVPPTRGQKGHGSGDLKPEPQPGA